MTKALKIKATSKVFAKSPRDVANAIIDSTKSYRDLVATVKQADTRGADHEQSSLRITALAAREFAYCLGESATPLYADFNDVKAMAYFERLVKGTTSKARAEKEKLMLITEAQRKRIRAHGRWWSRLLIDAGVKTVSKRGGHNRGQAAGKTTQGPTKQAKGNGNKADKALFPRCPDRKTFKSALHKQLAALIQFCAANKTPTKKGLPSPSEPFRAIIAEALRKANAVKIG